MPSFISPFSARAAFAVTSAVFAAALLSSVAASAGLAAEPPVICAALSEAAPAKLIESCTALIANPATSADDRLEAMITRAGAFWDKGQTAKALAEIDAVIAIA